MYKFIPHIKYEVNGTVYENGDKENSHYSLETEISDSLIKCVLHPKTKMKLIEFSLNAVRKPSHGERFFANGFQAWTTTREYGCNDTAHGSNPICKITRFTDDVANACGDYRFPYINYGEKGHFHSFTYTYFRHGESMELFGSMSEKTGYTVFDYNFDTGDLHIVKDVEGAVTDGDYTLCDVMRINGEYDEVFDKYFGSMHLRKPKIDHLSGYTSWYNYFQKIDEKIILRDLNGLDRARDEVSIFQIDDGYESKVGDWLVPDKKKFPNGMKPIADAIHKKGYLAGIWIAPFSVQHNAVLVREHPDWLLKDEKGRFIIGTGSWGGAYVLDLYNDEARKYIKEFFRVILHEWGFDMVKLDFLFSEAATPRDGRSRGQIMCEGMEFLRECVGEDKLLLGCGVPLGAVFGIADACRISCDVDLKYTGKIYNKMAFNNELPSAQNAINNSIFRRHLNGRVFCNDPDVFFLRNTNLSFTLEQKLLLGKINNMCGDVLFVSDNAGDYSKEETEYLKKFFGKSKCKILHAEYVSDEDIYIRFSENGEEKSLRFNIKTGKSNVKEIL